MLINFNKIILHNFLSYGHSEIDLADKHYCLVSGQNNSPDDNAASNGAGKSSWGSAICWVLTGETIQGLSSNIKNIYIEEDLCYVTLDFSVDKDNYIVTRYKNPKSNLTIILNGVDISGKGIRESETVLKQYLPDLSSQLIASIIILGQGLPYKFTANSPSGRKEVLERLSKSDFMIQDLKDRLTKRHSALNAELREEEDAILAETTKFNLLQNQINDESARLVELQKPHDFDSELSDLSAEELSLLQSMQKHNQKISELECKITEINNSLSEKLNEKSSALSEEASQFTEFTSEYLARKNQLLATINSLKKKITEIKAITDTCPTCGQKLPNIQKPSSEAEEQQLAVHEADLAEIERKYSAAEKEHKNYVNQIDQMYAEDISAINFNLKQAKQSLDLYKSDIKIKEAKLLDIRSRKVKLELEQKNLAETIKTAEEKLYNLSLTVGELSKQILYINDRKANTVSHLSVINQINTLIKRDFRGFLLSNIIDYICKKAKEYCLDIFGNDKLDFVLEGNNINISYNNRSFENLSGGEKQRVDLIIQFAIRDMMRHYLDFSSNIIILDEIFDQLDAVGCTNVLTLISNKLIDIESIFIISHRVGDLAIPYDCEMLVIKDEQGVSRIKWQ